MMVRLIAGSMAEAHVTQDEKGENYEHVCY